MTGLINFQAVASHSVAATAAAWLSCPPKNIFNSKDSCVSACCSGSNWDLTCIGFVEQVALKTNGYADLQLVAGFPRNGQTFGSAVVAWQAMISSKRSHPLSFEVPAGAAVFFRIDGFLPGHVAISSAHISPDGSPLIITTGAPGLNTGISTESLQELSVKPYWHYLGWADL